MQKSSLKYLYYVLHNLEFFVCPLSTKFHQNTSNDVTSMFHTCHTILVLRPTPSCAIHASQKKRQMMIKTSTTYFTTAEMT